MIEKWVYSKSGEPLIAQTAFLEALNGWFNEEAVRNAISSLSANKDWIHAMDELSSNLSALSHQEKYSDVVSYCLAEFVKRYIGDESAGRAITFDLIVPLTAMLYHLGLITVSEKGMN